MQRLQAAALARAAAGGGLRAALSARSRCRRCASARLAARLTAADLSRASASIPTARRCSTCLCRAATTSSATAPTAPTPEQVAALGRAVAEGLMAGGVLPVIKHIPGHGRATKDSHLDLPVVSARASELEAHRFRARSARLPHLPAAMTAHVVFAAIDADAPASTSARVTAEIIRGAIGFDGLLMSDDLGMRALTGSIARAGRGRARGGLGRGAGVQRRPGGNRGRGRASCRPCRGPRSPASSAPVPFSGNSSPSTWPRPRLALREALRGHA